MSEDQSQSETTGSAEVGLSQGDVDALLNSAPERSDNTGAISEPGSEGEVDTSVSQDDIDALISAANDPSATPGAMEESAPTRRPGSACRS